MIEEYMTGTAPDYSELSLWGTCTSGFPDSPKAYTLHVSLKEAYDNSRTIQHIFSRRSLSRGCEEVNSEPVQPPKTAIKTWRRVTRCLSRVLLREYASGRQLAIAIHNFVGVAV
jgi:hypothetical protein